MDHDDVLNRRARIVERGFLESGQPMLVVDPAGMIVLASDGAGVLFGLARAELRGRPLEQLLVLPQEAEGYWQSDRCESGQVHHLQIVHSQGALVKVEVQCFHFAVDAAPPAGDEPAPDPRHWLLVLTDVQQREHEDELRAARLAKLSLLNQVSEALYGADLSLEQVLEAVLICVTAGQGLRYNRAFLLLVDAEQQVLRGEIAIGPSNAEEASRIWRDLAGQPVDLFEMMTSYDLSIKQTDVAVNEIVRHMEVPLGETEHVLVRAMGRRQALCVAGNLDWPGVGRLRQWLGCAEFAVAPLTTRRGPLGVIVADNAISGNKISDLDLEFLQMFANQSASAIENSRLYRELERRLLDLRKAHQKQKEDQDTLLRMERLSVMGETSAIVAHELRNPLVAIGGFARTLERSLAETDPNRRFASIITEEVGRMERIIHDLLDFIRPRKQTRKRVVLDELVAETVGRFQGEIDSKELRLAYDLQAGSTELYCHPGEIQQVLQNFLVNAIQVLTPGGTIEVRSRVLEGGIKVEILDDGPGFAPDVADKLFSPFFSTKPTGSGLGLTICAQIIKSHGGVPGAVNRPEGGAAFSFILPLPKETSHE